MPESMDTLAAAFALSATIWLALGLGLAQLLKKQPARAHGILVAALIGTLITPVLYFGIRQANWGILPSRQEMTPLLDLSRDEALPAAVEPEFVHAVPQEMPGLEPVGERPTELNPVDPFAHFPELTDRTEPPRTFTVPIVVEEPRVEVASKFSWKGLMLWGWFGATVLLLFRLCLDFLAGYRLAKKSRPMGDEASTVREIETLARQLGLNSAPLLVLSEGIPSPVLWAWSRPARILVPAKTGASSALCGVYLHELAHLARRDHLSALLGEFVSCLFPWHPLAWLTKRSLEARAEEACDDWAIACGCQALDYAEELVHLAPSRAGALTMAAVSRSSRLKTRISRLLQGAFFSPRLGRKWVLGVGLAALLFTGFMSILQPRIVQAGAAEIEANEAKIGSEQGEPTPLGANATEVFVMAEGKPVAGARVWLNRLADAHLSLTWDGPMVSDQAGRVRFEVDKSNAFDAMGIDEKGRLGWVYLRRIAGSKPEPIMTLEPTTTREGVVVHLGKPVAGVKCKAVVVSSMGSPLRVCNFPERFPQGEVRSDEQGRIRVPLVPNGFRVLCEFTDERFAWQRAYLSPGSPNSISLMKAGSLELQFAGADHPIPSAHYRWYLTAKPSVDGKPPLNEIHLNSNLYEENQIPMKGNIIPLIEPGKYTLNIRSTASSPYLFKAKQELEIKPEQITKINIPTIKGVRVTGKILDAVSGQGIPHYRFSLYSSHVLRANRPRPPRESDPDLREWADGITDKNGDYEVYVRGKARYGFVYNSDHNMTANVDQYRLTQYDRETNTLGVQADVPETGSLTFPELRLTPSQKAVGQMVDKQGRPISGMVDVFDPIWPSKENECLTEREVKDGSFTWTGFPPERPLNLRIRQGKAVNVPAELTPEQWKNGLKVTLDEGNAVTFVGQVQDQHGNPVPKTQVGLDLYCLMKGGFGSRNENRTMEAVETDEQGRFIMKGHWPKERYLLKVYKEGYAWSGFPSPSLDKKESFDEENDREIVYFSNGQRFHMHDMKMGQPGETVDYGIIKLIKNTNLIRGKTVGLDGQPIAGIELSALAEGRGSLKTTSNAQGQFELSQLLEGVGILIAKGPGYRAAYVSFHAGDLNIAIPMRKTTEPALALPAIPKTFLAAREKMTRHILESIWKSRQSNGWGARMLESMVALDPARAKEWIDQATPQEKATWESLLRPMSDEEVSRLALIDVADGIAAARKMKPASVYHLLRVGEILLKTNKEITLRFAEEAVVELRAMGPERYTTKAPGLAYAGALVWRAGEKESGRKLLQEGIDVLEKDPENRSFADCNFSICASLASVDWTEAKKRLDLFVDPYQYNIALSMCIDQIAKEDLHGAKDKLAFFKEEKERSSSFPVKCRLQIAAKIAQTDPDEALKVLEALQKGRVFRHAYAQGLAELAMQIHPRDAAKAHRLIDQAFDFLDRLEGSSSGTGMVGTSAMLGAQIVHQAGKIGYPDPQALIVRTLGYVGRPPIDRYPWAKSYWRQWVMALALTDPTLAKNVLEIHISVEGLAKEWSGGENHPRKSHDRREAGFALALIDPEKTIRAFDSMAAKSWTSDTVSSAAISEIFGSFAKKGDLMENIAEWEALGRIR